jgi:hypothetical protein
MKTILVILAIHSGWGAPNIKEHRYPMASMDECLSALSYAKLELSPGDENEQSVVMLCTHAPNHQVLKMKNNPGDEEL